MREIRIPAWQAARRNFAPVFEWEKSPVALFQIVAKVAAGMRHDFGSCPDASSAGCSESIGSFGYFWAACRRHV
jgi:hypothetical protein